MKCINCDFEMILDSEENRILTYYCHRCDLKRRRFLTQLPQPIQDKPDNIIPFKRKAEKETV